MAEIPVTFAVSGGELIATVTGTGDGGVENGLQQVSTPFSSTGSIDLDLGGAVPSASSFNFVLVGDSADFVVGIASDQTLTTLDVTGQTTPTGPAPSDLATLKQFWDNATQANVTAALGGALESWIEENAASIPVLIIVGLVTGGSAFLLSTLATGGDLFAIFVTELAKQEVSSGTLSQDQANEIIQWAKIGDLVTQIPAVLTDENTISRVINGLAADINFESTSDDVKLGVSIASNTVTKYVLALTALKQ